MSRETGSEHLESSLSPPKNTSDLDLAQPDAINSQTDQEPLPAPPVETKHNNPDLNS